MIHFVDIIIISGEDKILISRRWKNRWEFIRKEIKEGEARDLVHLYAINNLDNFKLDDINFLEKHEWLGGKNDEEVIADVEYWTIKLEYTPKIKPTLTHPWHYWIGKDEAKTNTRNYEPDVFHYIQRYFGLC